MNVSFYLHSKQDRKKRRFIFCQYTNNGSKWRFTTQFKIRASDWNKRKGSPKPGYIHSESISRALSLIEDEVLGIAYKLKADLKEPVPDLVREGYNNKRKVVTVSKAWSEFDKSHLQELAKNTQKRFKTTRNNLASIDPNWRDFGQEWGDTFKKHLASIGNSPDTASKKLSDVKTFLKFCKKKGWLKTDHFLDWETPIKGKTEQIYLTLEEIGRIRELDCEKEHLSNTKNLFLFHCLTGLRYGDGQKIVEDNINFKKSSLEITLEKTSTRISIPICIEAMDLLRSGLPRMINQVFNRNLKVLCKDAGINEKVLHRGIFQEKWKTVTTHTARRSFITNLLNQGVPPHLVGGLVGHSDIKTTSRYDQSGFKERRDIVDTYLNGGGNI